MNNHITPDYITSLRENESRRSGIHWKGAAAFTLENFGAIFGQGDGIKVNHMQ